MHYRTCVLIRLAVSAQTSDPARSTGLWAWRWTSAPRISIRSLLRRYIFARRYYAAHNRSRGTARDRRVNNPRVANYVSASDVLSSRRRFFIRTIPLFARPRRGRDVMDPLFLGYLYLYMAITPIAGSDPSRPYNTSEESSYKNCTQCNVKPSASCVCVEITDGPGCKLCCVSNCCFCGDCSFCLRAEWQLITMTHMSISILFVLGITGLILMYCKLCNRTRQPARSRCFRTQQELNGATCCSTVEDSRERPPTYSEVCGAPPLYASPYNRTSMQDAPPRYPDTPKCASKETCRCVRDISVPPVVQHM